MISQELLIELKLILKEDFGLVLTIEEVKEIGTSYVDFFDLLMKLNHKPNLTEENKIGVNASTIAKSLSKLSMVKRIKQ